MAAPRRTLLRVDQLVALATEANEMFWSAADQGNGLYRDDDRDEIADCNGRTDMARQALLFVCAQAAYAGDAALFPTVLDAIEPILYYDTHRDDLDSLWGAIRALVGSGVPIDESVAELAKSEQDDIREAVAGGLPVDSEPALALLEQLARDPVGKVRTAARRRIQTVRELPWWIGKWKHDPTAGLDAAELQRVRPLLTKIVAILDRGNLYGAAEELARLCEVLPHPACVELLEHVLLDDNLSRFSNALGAVLVTRQGGPEGLVRLVERAYRDDQKYWHRHSFPGFWKGVPAAQRVADAMLLARAALAAPVEEGYQSLAASLAEIAEKVFPDGEDLNPLLDLILSADPEHGHNVLYHLAEPLNRAGALTSSIVERVVAACADGFPGRWQEISYKARPLLEGAAPELRRRAVEAAVAGTDESTMEWGLEQLLGPCWDEARDPARPTLARQLYREPRFRKAFTSSAELRFKVCPFLRADLRAGLLDFSDAANAMQTINCLYGGLIAFDLSGEVPSAAKIAKAEAERRKEHRPYLGPKAMQGPITEVEWRCYRAARARAELEKRRDWMDALAIMPEGAWLPEDRAFYERAVESWRSGDGQHEYALLLLLSVNGSVDDLPVVDEIVRREDNDGSHTFRDIRRAMRARLGLDPKEGERALGADGEDEDEEDDGEEGGDDSGEGDDEAEEDWMDQED